MFDIDPAELAVRGERGTDLFLRSEDPGQKRARFRCIATQRDTEQDTGGAPQLIDYEPAAGRKIEQMMARARARADSPLLSRPFSLADTCSWPHAGDAPDPMLLFLYQDLMRAWQVVDIATQRLIRQVMHSGDALPLSPQQIAGAIAPILDFNRLTPGVTLARHLIPVLSHRVTQPGYRDHPSGATGYALRMLGDLCLRADHADLALACFETAVTAGDNPFRRRKAIEAAHAANNTTRRCHHIDAYSARWTLPDDLALLSKGNTT